MKLQLVASKNKKDWLHKRTIIYNPKFFDNISKYFIIIFYKIKFEISNEK